MGRQHTLWPVSRAYITFGQCHRILESARRAGPLSRNDNDTKHSTTDTAGFAHRIKTCALSTLPFSPISDALLGNIAHKGRFILLVIVTQVNDDNLANEKKRKEPKEATVETGQRDATVNTTSDTTWPWCLARYKTKRHGTQRNERTCCFTDILKEPAKKKLITQINELRREVEERRHRPKQGRRE